MRRRLLPLASVAALAAALAGCAAAPVAPPPVIATIPVAPPTPAMPVGGYVGMEIPAKLDDGRYITPNIDMSPAAAVWHLRGALNVAALVCDTGTGPIVTAYNDWLRGHRPVLDAHVKQYLKEWEETGWGDWQAAYDNHQTRLYNFYSQQPMRAGFCPIAAQEVATVASVEDSALPAHAKAALGRLDRPFTEFFRAYERWEDYYYADVKVVPPRVVPTLPYTPAPQPPQIAVAADVLEQ